MRINSDNIQRKLYRDLLINHGADLTIRDLDDRTPEDIADLRSKGYWTTNKW